MFSCFKKSFKKYKVEGVDIDKRIEVLIEKKFPDIETMIQKNIPDIETMIQKNIPNIETLIEKKLVELESKVAESLQEPHITFFRDNPE